MSVTFPPAPPGPGRKKDGGTLGKCSASILRLYVTVRAAGFVTRLTNRAQATCALRPSSLRIDGCCLGVHVRVELRHTLLRSPLAHPTGSRAGRTRSLPAGLAARAGGGT